MGISANNFYLFLSVEIKDYNWLFVTQNLFCTHVSTFFITGDGFGNQSYLMIHLFTLANLLVQFRHKKTTPLPFRNVFTIEDALSVQ